MNNILELRGKKFVQAARKNAAGGISMNGVVSVNSSMVNNLISQLSDVLRFWKTEKRPFDGALISVHYNKIVAKSNRISGILKGAKSNECIVGAKFNEDKTQHIITYYISLKNIEDSIKMMKKASEIIIDKFSDYIDSDVLSNDALFNKIDFESHGISKSKFKQIVADVSYIDHFDVDVCKPNREKSIITLYNTGVDTKIIFKNLGINVLSTSFLDDNTVLLDENQLSVLTEKAPYLIAMTTVNFKELSPSDFRSENDCLLTRIPSPKNEPTIGVIDTLFDTEVYFSEWVEYHEMLDPNIPFDCNAKNHGTGVTSIIVDGPRMNPWLDDGCGRFRVRHFGVATSKGFSSFTLMRKIKTIIKENSDIKVWNLSLGSSEEIDDNFISAEAATLDKIQYENDVIFVIAGTNKKSEDVEKIGSPADCINGVVVNSVSKSGLSVPYSRKGLALSFFAKPDVSYYGGSEEQLIVVREPFMEAKVSGTSYAAPWISRKLSYLIDVIGLNRELAKTLLIDSARGWDINQTPEKIALYGHGIVPIKIEDIVNTSDDEIKFLVSDVSEKWNTYNYNFPVPLKNDKYPYMARATMCYFPKCNRSQGVDYTNTELNLHFGRLKDDGSLNEINGDKQNLDYDDDDDKKYILEGTARKRFRKWDNVKYVTDSETKKEKKSYTNKNWGMEIKTNNRLDPKDGEGVRFGVVVTLKEINGVNRIDEFIYNCNLKGWIVNPIDIKSRVNLRNKASAEIDFQ